MREIDFKVLKFLLEGKAYSNNAVMKNFGLNELELEEVYLNLQKEGFIETYSEYERRTSAGSEEKKGCGCSKGGCHSGEHGEKKCCSSDSWDYEKVWVLTEKASEMIF